MIVGYVNDWKIILLFKPFYKFPILPIFYKNTKTTLHYRKPNYSQIIVIFPIIILIAELRSSSSFVHFINFLNTMETILQN